MRTETRKAERLFRAAISAFCSLPRPSRREIAQLEDLALPLFDEVPDEALRFGAAALSETEYAPRQLVLRLAESKVDVAAPLLIRSAVLSDVDLIALISRHGLPHARAIGRRKDLNPAIAHLIRALERPKLAVTRTAVDETVEHAKPKPGEAAEDVRHRLRAMMGASAAARDTTPYSKLRETALSGNLAFFQTALADALRIDFATAHSIVVTSDYARLLSALKVLELGEDHAFLIAVAVFPQQFPHPQAIRLFLDRYRLLPIDAARNQLSQWQLDAMSPGLRDARQTTANSDKPVVAQPKFGKNLKKS
ncbi:hypothetical protein ACFWXH_03080 [Mesorhizobium sp. NPDC059054]|uniref:hypothetical protein n=1 Tax=Mesorhizobium sp. NPDC059054 TaxID=3346711 RepID=UPI00367389D7